MKKFEFHIVEKEEQLVVLQFDGEELSVWRVYTVEGAWTAPCRLVAEECATSLQMEIIPCIGMPVVAKASWAEGLFIFTRSEASEIDIERLTEVYKKTFGE